MKKIFIASLTFLSLCFFSCSDDDVTGGDDGGVIFGFVTEFGNGEPVSGANVQLRPSGQTIQTGSNGRFQFSNVRAGSYEGITVSKFGYSDLVDPHGITIRTGESFQRDVMIARQPVPLRLVDSDGSTNDNISGLNFSGSQNLRSFSIFNDNPYVLDWVIHNTSDWISVNLSSGTLSANGGQQPIVVTIDRALQPNNIFSASIVIESDAGTRDLVISTQFVSLTLNASPAIGGTVSPTSQTNIAPGTQVNISATANPNYTFVNWTVANGTAEITNPTNSVTTVFLSSDATITANFQNNSIGGPTGSSLADQLRDLHAVVESGGEYTIELTGNENIGAQPLSFENKSDVTVRIVGIDSERIVQLTDNGSLFTIGTGITLILDNRVTLRGRTGNNSPLVRVNARGTLVMKTGARISNNTNTNDFGGGVFVATDGIFTMEGGEISGNASSSYNRGGGGVYVASGGFFSMENGRISGNGHNSYSGGGVYLAGGVFNIRNGEIINNNASNGGGVYVGGGTFTMSDGRIANNTAHTTSTSSGGGGVYVGNATFAMEGGEISGNTARSGGGVFVEIGWNSNAHMTKTGGTIYGYVLGDPKRNTATAGISTNDRGHAVFVNSTPNKRRETTAGETLQLDSDVTGAAGGWE